MQENSVLESESDLALTNTAGVVEYNDTFYRNLFETYRLPDNQRNNDVLVQQLITHLLLNSGDIYTQNSH